MPTDVSTYSSTPQLRVADQLNPSAMGDLLELTVSEDISGMSSCEARFVGWGASSSGAGFRYLDRATLDFGTRLSVGFGPQPTTLFTGTVSSIVAEFPESSVISVSVTAEDALWALRTTRHTRSWEDVSTSDLAAQLASDHGLTPDIDLDGPTRSVATQVNLSDLAYLRELAYADGGEVWLEDGTLHVQRRADRQGGSLTLSYGADLESFTVRADLAHQVTDVAVSGWSVSDKEAISETGDADALEAELGGVTSGSGILSGIGSERHECVPVDGPLDRDDARTRAKAAYLDRARRFVVGHGTTGGTPELRVGARVTLAGIGPLFNGDYRCVWARHSFDLVNGYRTEFEVERPGIGAAS